MENKKQKVDYKILFEAEIESLKVLNFSFCFFIACTILGFILGSRLGIFFMESWQFKVLIAIVLLVEGFLLLDVRFIKKIFFAKYLIFFIMIVEIALAAFWVQSFWLSLGFFLLVAMAGFFNDWKISLFAGIFCLATFFVLTFLIKPFFFPVVLIWMIFFIPFLFVVIFVTKRNHDFLHNLFEKNEQISDAKTSLEIKVKARTKELEEIAFSLEGKIFDRTKQLREKINDLEKFQKITIGRELKMIELKKELEKFQAKRKIKS